MPRISIIVPVFNSEEVISQCLESIIGQNFTDFELLLINDGSTDRSGDICEEYSEKDNRIRVFHKQNGGVSSARNIGLENAKGEWITFCDSDDFVDSDWLDIYITSINKNDVDMVCQGIHRAGLYASSSEYCVGVEYNGDNKGALKLLWESLLLGYVWNKIFKKSILDDYNLRFDERFVFMEDENFVLRYLKHCKLIVCEKKTGYNYNMPDLSRKYNNVDNYYTSLSNFESVKSIYGSEFNEVCQEYINVLTNAFFASYSFNINDIKFRLKSYKHVVGSDIIKVNGLSFITKVFYFLPLRITNLMYLLKSVVNNKYNRFLKFK